MWKKYFKKLSVPESYISLTLGFLVTLVGALLIYNYFNKEKIEETKSPEQKEEERVENQVIALPTTHTVTLGETLWSIAEKYYHSGYNWVTIAQENNLANPDYIQEGQVLAIPKAETIKPAGEISSTEISIIKEYTVIKGDNLWNIAVREYGDGFAWVKIAQANNLSNPDLIHAGNVLKIPR